MPTALPKLCSLRWTQTSKESKPFIIIPILPSSYSSHFIGTWDSLGLLFLVCFFAKKNLFGLELSVFSKDRDSFTWLNSEFLTLTTSWKQKIYISPLVFHKYSAISNLILKQTFVFSVDPVSTENIYNISSL